MYESFFQFKSKPFDLVPNPEFMFLSKTHKRAMTYLNYGIRERAGFILLTGEVGSGKTTIIRDLIERCDERIVLGKVFNTNVNAEQLIAIINDDFDLPVKGRDKISLLRDLNHFLVEQYANGKQPLLIIDEAQNLAPDALEEVRMLSNLETADSKLLQILLVGQPELRIVLAKPELRQLRQRISIQCHLQPLSRQELPEYILHRLQVAGNRDALHFAPEALELIYKYSGGIPRLINILGDFLLIFAFAEQVRDVDESLVRDIISDMDFDNNYSISGTGITYPGTSLAGSEKTQQEISQFESRIATQFDEVYQRLAQMDINANTASQTAFKEISEQVALLNKTLKFHMKQTDNSIYELSRMIEKAASVNSKIEKPIEIEKKRKSDLVRFLLG
jgi:putative secretion ATPase (PEP-CTERM system associated)